MEVLAYCITPPTNPYVTCISLISSLTASNASGDSQCRIHMVWWANVGI